MKILAIEPYFGGSHRAFLEGWASRSCHEFEFLTAPAHNWKWRMRHSAVTFADQAVELHKHFKWDAIFCSDMLPLAEFLGLIPAELRTPTVAYFHENQLTYPVQNDDPRDVHFGLTNMTTALAADAVWFNSDFHQQEFLTALDKLLSKMPQPSMRESVDKIRAKSHIEYPGVEISNQSRESRKPGSLRIVWAARWEHDKNPQAFFDALKQLIDRGVEFEVSVIGEQFRSYPPCFDEAKEFLGERIFRWGYQPTRQDYIDTLIWADVAVSTADHEFFGICMVEAAACGARPLLPDRLAYPEIFKLNQSGGEFFYDGSAAGLAKKLADLANLVGQNRLWSDKPNWFDERIRQFCWERRAKKMDSQIESNCSNALNKSIK